MVYYPDHGKSRVKITKADYDVLGEFEMLNDSAIDFYLKWIEHVILVQSKSMVQEFLFFGTFFFKKMTTTVKVKSTTARVDRLSSVEKYNSRGGQSIWDRRFLVIPINEAFHWSLVIACIAPVEDKVASSAAAASVQEGDDQAGEGEASADGDGRENHESEAAAPAPRKIDLLYFDSLGHRGRKHCLQIIEYLNYKWNKEYCKVEGENPHVDRPYTMPPAVNRRSGRSSSPTEEYDDDGGATMQVNIVEKKAPHQENGHDCGVFLLEYAERFVKDIMFQDARGTDYLSYLQRTDFQEWFDAETVKHKRTHMQALLKFLEKRRQAIEMQEVKQKEQETKAAAAKSSADADAGDDQTGKENIEGGNADTAAAAAAAAAADSNTGGSEPKYSAAEILPPRQKLEVWMQLKNQGKGRGKTNVKSFEVEEQHIDSVEGMAILMKDFKEWFEDTSGADIGDVQDLKLYRRFTVATGPNIIELDLKQTPEQNFLTFGDNLLVESACFEAKQAKERAEAEVIDDDDHGGDDDDDDFQADKGGKAATAAKPKTQRNVAPGRLASLNRSTKSALPATGKIPRKTSKNDKRQQQAGPPPLPPKADEEEKEGLPGWVHEQAAAAKPRTRNPVSADSSSDDEGDGDGERGSNSAPPVNPYGKRRREDADDKEDGDSAAAAPQPEASEKTALGFKHKKNKAPPPLPPIAGVAPPGPEDAPPRKRSAPRPSSEGQAAMLNLAGSGSHLNKR